MWTAYTGLDVYSAYIRMTYLSDGSGSRCSWVENSVENVALVLHNPDALQPGRTRGFVAGTFLQRFHILQLVKHSRFCLV